MYRSYPDKLPIHSIMVDGPARQTGPRWAVTADGPGRTPAVGSERWAGGPPGVGVGPWRASVQRLRPTPPTNVWYVSVCRVTASWSGCHSDSGTTPGSI